MISQKWIKTDSQDSGNHEGVNLFSTVFSVIFTTSNLFLASLLLENKRITFFLTTFIVMATLLTLIISNFDLSEASLLDFTKIIIVFAYSGVLVISFGFLSNKILQSQIQEARVLFLQRGEYKKMFDSLQEGIIVI